MKTKRLFGFRILFLLVFALLLLCLPGIVSAEQYFLIYLDVGEQTTNVSRFDVIEYNELTADIAPEGDYQGYDDFTIEIKGYSGEIIRSFSVHQGDNVLDYVSGAANFVLLKSGEELFSSDITFCNNNNYCEPCLTGFCELAENAISCSDCRSAAFDNFCNPVDDGECDADCDSTDPDCERIYGSTDPITSEYVETQIELQNQPGMSITPSGFRASTVLEAGIDTYCTHNLRGEICGLDAYCDGEELEYYYDTYCCIGQCVYEFGYDFEDQGALPLYEEESEFANNLSEFEPLPEIIFEDEDLPEDFYEQLDARDAAHEAIVADIDLAEQEAEKPSTAEKITEAIPDEIKGFNLVVIVGILLGIMIVILGLLAMFRRSADTTIKQEENITQPTPTINLQNDIDGMLSKGFNYTQVRDTLMRQGHSQQEVVAEINKNYAKRKSLQSGGR